MVIRLLLLGFLVLLGCSTVVLGIKGIVNKRVLNGTMLIAVGIVCVGLSGLRIYEQIYETLTDDRIVETRALLKEVQERQKHTEASRKRFVEQLEREIVQIKTLEVSPDTLVELVHTDSAIRSSVERIALLNRWIALCDEQVTWDAHAIQSYENILFYYNNLQIMGTLQFDTTQAAAAEIDLDRVIEEAKKQPQDASPLDITREELQSIVTLLTNH